MKRLMIALITTVALATAVWAETGPTEQDYKNLDDLRSKLVRMKKEMDKFVKDIVSTSDQAVNSVGVFGQDIKVDVMEKPDNIIVKADLPGMEKDKIEVTLMNSRILKIGGSRDMVREEQAQGAVRQERLSGKFERILELPAECLNKGIKAAYNNGVLEIDIPKRKSVKKETVKVKVQ